jgi:hypothetical protein
MMKGMRAPKPSGPKALQQRAQAANQESRADKIESEFRGEIQRAADEEGRGDRRCRHDQNMLQAKQK